MKEPKVSAEGSKIAAVRIRYVYRQVHVLLRREGWQIGRNVVYRFYREEGLALRTQKPRRRKMVVARQARPMPMAANQAWSMDFVHDQLGDGHVESSNGTVRDECLNIHWFGTFVEAGRLIEAWWRDYNVSRPHMALANLTPAEYAARARPSTTPMGVIAAVD